MHASSLFLRTPSAAALLRRALVRLELDEFFRHVVIVALREDAQHRQARLVHVDTSAQRHPAGDAALAGYVLHLQHGHPHGAVLSGEAVVLHAYLQLVALRTDLSTQGAETESRPCKNSVSDSPSAFKSTSIQLALQFKITWYKMKYIA